MPGDYNWYNRTYQDVSMELVLAAADGDATLITGKANYSIFVQRIMVYITTSAAQSLAFEDSATTPYKIWQVTATPVDETLYSADWGPEGIPLTVGKDFLLNVSAAGVAGTIKVYAYLKQTSNLIANAGALLQ